VQGSWYLLLIVWSIVVVVMLLEPKKERERNYPALFDQASVDSEQAIML